MSTIRKPFALFAAAALAACAGSSPDPDSNGGEAAWRLLEGGWMLDVVAGERVPNPGVLVAPDGQIARVGGQGQAAPEGAEPEVIELAEEQTLLPGVVDLHANYNTDLTGDGRVEEPRYNPLIFLANGVTTTFPAGEYYPEVMRALAERLESGEQPGPRLLRSGPYFGRTR